MFCVIRKHFVRNNMCDSLSLAGETLRLYTISCNETFTRQSAFDTIFRFAQHKIGEKSVADIRKWIDLNAGSLWQRQITRLFLIASGRTEFEEQFLRIETTGFQTNSLSNKIMLKFAVALMENDHKNFHAVGNKLLLFAVKGTFTYTPQSTSSEPASAKRKHIEQAQTPSSSSD